MIDLSTTECVVAERVPRQLNLQKGNTSVNLTSSLYLFGAFLAGVMIPIQTGFNVQLTKAIHSPLLSTLAVYIVGLVCVAVATLAMRVQLPSSTDILAAPRLSWVAGGVLSACYIVLLIALLPRLGAATTVAFVVLGQISCSLLIDHFALLGFPMQHVTPLRLTGAAIMAIGVVMVRLF